MLQEVATVCPLGDKELVDRVLVFVEEFTRTTRIGGADLYTYQKVFARRIVAAVLFDGGDVITSLFSRQCVGKDQVVLNPDGSACRMKDAPGAWKTYARRQVYSVSARGGYTLDSVTKDHVFFTPVGERCLGDLRVGDAVAVVTRQSKWAKKTHIKSIIDEFQNRHTTWKTEVKTPVSHKLMRLLGYLTADGSTWRALENGQSPKFTNIRDEYLTEVALLVKELFPTIAVRWYPKGKGHDLVFTGGKASFKGNEFSRFLRSIRWDGGFPLDVFDTSLPLASSFLNRLFSADGCVQARRLSIELSCTELTYARYCQALLLKMGIRSTVKREWMKKSTKYFYRLIITGAGNILRFEATVGAIYGKEQGCRELFRWYHTKPDSGDVGGGKGFVNRRMYPTVEKGRDGELVAWSVITKIEPAGTDEVWDREVVGKGWFTGQGFKLHNSGKTQTVADVAVSLCVVLPVLAREFPDDIRLKPFSAGFWVGVFAPIIDLAGISFGRMREAVTADSGVEMLADPELGVTLTRVRGDELGFSHGSVVRAKSASPDTKIEGKTYHLVIIDEAQKVLRSKVEKEIKPMLSATNGVMVKIGTAWESRGGFHTDISFNIEQYKAGGKRNHFEFDYKMVIAEKTASYQRDGNPFHLNYKKFLTQTIMRLGGIAAAEKNEEFRMNYMLMWSESRIIAFRPGILVAGRVEDLELNVPTYRPSLVAGLDVGKSNDSTILTIMHVDYTRPIVDVSKMGTPHEKRGMVDGEEEVNIFYMKTIVALLELQGLFEGDSGQYQQVVDFLADYAVSTFVVDCTGMGDPVAERFGVLLEDILVVPFRYSTSSKSDLYRYYLQEWYAGRIRYAYGEQSRDRVEIRNFESQHLDLDRVVKSGYVLCEAPEDAHDDYPDAGALAAHGERLTKNLAMPTIVVTGGDAKRADPGIQVRALPQVGMSSNIPPTASQANPNRADRYRYGRGRR